MLIRIIWANPPFLLEVAKISFTAWIHVNRNILGTLMLQRRKMQLWFAAHAARSLCARQRNADADLLVLAVENHVAVHFLSAPIEKQFKSSWVSPHNQRWLKAFWIVQRLLRQRRPIQLLRKVQCYFSVH